MRDLLAVRAVRHGALTTAVVLVVCAVIGANCLLAFRSASAQLAGLDARAVGKLTKVGVAGEQATVQVRWKVGHRQFTADVPFAGTPPPVGTRSDVAYDPRDPHRAVIPRAQVFRTLDRSATGLGLMAGLALAVVLFDGWLLVSRARLFNRQGQPVILRRIRLQRGLIRRSWLETEQAPERWIPVHFDPALVTLPTPSQLLVHGDLRTARLVAATIPPEITGSGSTVRLYPSGPVRHSLPPGRRSDNPATPDSAAAEDAHASARLRRQIVADAPRLAIAPVVGVFWAILDNSGIIGWLAATGVVAAVGAWLAAVRGSDPS